jgi:AraC family transcriptional regulator, melibiose operon regulatory protein
LNNSIYNPQLTLCDYDITLSAYYFRSKNNFTMAQHSHNRLEFMYVTEGHCNISTEQHSYPLTRGHIIFIDANTPHNLVIPEQHNCRMLNLEFTFQQHYQFMPSMRTFIEATSNIAAWIESKQEIIHFSDSGILMGHIKSIIVEKERNQDPIKIQLLIYQFLLDFSKLFIQYKDDAIYTPYINTTIEYLYNHYDCDLNMSIIAKHLNLHPNYLHRIFKEQMGMSVIDYLNHIRFERAATLLDTTKLSIQEISELIGINSRQYFTNRFKSFYHMSPGQFRKKGVPYKLLNDNHTKGLSGNSL